MKFTLPLTGKEVEIKDYMPHGVATRSSQALYKGMDIPADAMTSSSADMIDAFGADVMSKVDELPEKEREEKIQQLRGKLIQKKMKVGSEMFENMETSNWVKIDGMVLSFDGKKVTRDLVDELPEADYKAIIDAITEREQSPLVKPSATPVKA